MGALSEYKMHSIKHQFIELKAACITPLPMSHGIDKLLENIEKVELSTLQTKKELLSLADGLLAIAKENACEEALKVASMLSIEEMQEALQEASVNA